MGLVKVSTDKRGFSTPVTPVSSGGMLRHARSIDDLLNDMLNGEQAFRRMLMQTATTKTIASGVITPTLALHYVTSESGTSDNLDTITAVNNTWLVLLPTATHTITLRHGVGNITVTSGADVVMSQGAALLYCENSQWAYIGTFGNKNNFIATSDPGSGDDTGDGYLPGSLWLNTQRDRLWVNVDATLTTAIWKRVGDWNNGFRIRAAASTAHGVGIATPTLASPGGGPTGVIDTDTFISFISAGSAGSAAGAITTSFDLTRPQYDPVITCEIQTRNPITTSRIWIGLTSADVTNVDTLAAGTKFIGFRYSDPAGDTGWRPVLNDGTTQTTGTAIGTVAISTTYILRIRIDSNNSRAYFSVNNSAEQVVSTNLPAITSDLGACVRVITSSGASLHTLYWSYFEVNW